MGEGRKFCVGRVEYYFLLHLNERVVRARTSREDMKSKRKLICWTQKRPTRSDRDFLSRFFFSIFLSFLRWPRISIYGGNEPNWDVIVAFGTSIRLSSISSFPL